MWRGEQADAQSRRTVNAFEHRACRAFAIGAGDVDEAEFILRIAGVRGELKRVLQPKIRAEHLQAVEKINSGGVSQTFIILHSASILSAKAACGGCARGWRR